MRYCPNCHAAIQSDTQKSAASAARRCRAAAPEQPAPAEAGLPPLSRNPNSPFARRKTPATRYARRRPVFPCRNRPLPSRNRRPPPPPAPAGTAGCPGAADPAAAGFGASAKAGSCAHTRARAPHLRPRLRPHLRPRPAPQPTPAARPEPVQPAPPPEPAPQAAPAAAAYVPPPQESYPAVDLPPIQPQPTPQPAPAAPRRACRTAGRAGRQQAGHCAGGCGRGAAGCGHCAAGWAGWAGTAPAPPLRKIPAVRCRAAPRL